MTVAVLVPTLGRPHRIREMMADLYATVTEDEVRLYFIAETHDLATLEEIIESGAFGFTNDRSPSYAGAINTGLLETTEPFIFTGADDLHFHEGWLPPLLERAQEFGLVGTNDLYNREVLDERHATHFLVTREYALTGCVDAPGVLLHEGYTHNYVDTEAVGTAISRGQFAPCMESVVEHRHWLWGLSPMDATYEKGRDTEQIDRATFETRRALWM